MSTDPTAPCKQITARQIEDWIADIFRRAIAYKPSDPAPVGDDLLVVAKALCEHLDRDAPVSGYGPELRAAIEAEEVRRATPDPPPSPGLLAAAEALCEHPGITFGRNCSPMQQLRDAVAAESARPASPDTPDRGMAAELADRAAEVGRLRNKITACRRFNEAVVDAIGQYRGLKRLNPILGWEADPAIVLGVLREIVAAEPEPRPDFERLAEGYRRMRLAGWERRHPDQPWEGSDHHTETMAFIATCRGGTAEPVVEPGNFRAALERIATDKPRDSEIMTETAGRYRAYAQRALDAGPEAPVVDGELVAILDEFLAAELDARAGVWECLYCHEVKQVKPGTSFPHKEDCVRRRAAALVARVRSRS